MAIMGDDNQRIDQSGGLNPDSGALSPSPILIKPVEDDVLRLTILMLGGGPAIRGITQRVFHKHSVETVIDEIVNRAIPAVSQLGCSPCTLAIGIGRSQFEATSLMMEAMVKGNYNIQTEFEKTITDCVNQSNTGALGLGGKTSVLATFAKVGPQRSHRRPSSLLLFRTSKSDCRVMNTRLNWLDCMNEFLLIALFQSK